MFVTDTGVVVPGVTAAEMREVDRIALEETGPNLYQMMENAGRALAGVALATLGENRAASVLVLAGTGGNGGGGITAARHLANRGVDVALWVTDVPRLTDVPAKQHELYRHAGGSTITAPPVRPPDLVIDAVIGYSLTGAPRGVAAEMIHAANGWSRSGSRILALDVPSGLDATTGLRAGAAVRPAVTMTLALPKCGLTAPDVGEVLLADIGIPVETYDRAGVSLPGPVFDDRFVVPIEPRPGGD